ncbi:MAG: pyruvate kinase [Deltaproteobacteria bacterium]|nr:pyruvate kinase [Deltaproteobacteria bacterium]
MNLQDCRRRTKIVCTLGPASSSPDMIRAMIRMGMDVARLNFSHGDHETHGQAILELRRAAEEIGRPVGVLMDLSGPKIRLGEMPEHQLTIGQEVTLATGEKATGEEIPVNYQYLIEDVEVGHRILCADGKVELKVMKKEAGRLYCQVIVGGKLTSHKGVNLPNSDLRIPAFTDKDRRDLEFGLSRDVDFVAMSFVRHERDLAPVREIIQKSEHPPLLIAKIEKPQALDRLPQILTAVDGVMVARGDLGVEMPVEKVPVIQKLIIQEARRAGRIVITATQMLASMISDPRPSRAEVADVANAIFDGTDAVMLSDETTIGQYPLEAVDVLSKVAWYTEPQLNADRFLDEEISELLPHTGAAISRAAAWLAHDMPAMAMVAATTSGLTARLTSRMRPSIAIIGLTSRIKTFRQLSMCFGVIPALIKPCLTVDELAVEARQWVRDQALAKPGDRLVMTAGLPLQSSGTTNFLKIVEV